MGIPILVWGCLDPHFGLGIPESVWGLFVICISISVWGSLFWFGDPQTNMGIPKLKWGVPVFIQDDDGDGATGDDDDGNGATGDGATGYNDDNDGDWQR